MINAGLMRTALRTCQSNVPSEISKVRMKPVTKIPAPIGVRMNGYLSYSRVGGDTRLNAAKMAEIADRKSM